MGREWLSLGPCERGWVQEGGPRVDLGCRPSGFRQVKVPICVSSTQMSDRHHGLLCRGVAVLPPHQQPVTWHLNSPYFMLRRGRGPLCQVCWDLFPP